MGRKSTKANKSIYQISRERAGYTRKQASERMEYISPQRIEKIENHTTRALPEDILTMANCYREPTLCNYYCSHECAIGKRYVPEIHMKDLSQIVLEILNLLNSLENEKTRLIEITVSGAISPDNSGDFKRILNMLNQVSVSIETLKILTQEY